LLLVCQLQNFRWKFLVVKIATFYTQRRYATLKKQNGQKWTDHPKSENVKVETEIKEKVNRVTKIERVEKEKIY